jgi:hypothetical protein
MIGVVHRMPKSTSRTWSVYSAIDHMSDMGRRCNATDGTPAMASAHRAPTWLMASIAAASVQASLLKPHLSQRSADIP